MSKELILKSETAKRPDRKVAMVRLGYDFVAWGINSSQLSEQMQSLHLSWNGDVLVVTHDGFPGLEKWVFPGAIRELTWKAE